MDLDWDMRSDSTDLVSEPGELSADPELITPDESLFFGSRYDYKITVRRQDGSMPTELEVEAPGWIIAAASPANMSREVTLTIDAEKAGPGEHIDNVVIYEVQSSSKPVTVALQYEVVVPIYRSVGGGIALASGSAANTLSVVGSVASFNTALPARAGVGDALQYDTDGDDTPDAIGFVHRRTSATELTLRDSSGRTPTATQGSTSTWTLHRAYSSLADADDAIENTSIVSSLRNFDDWNTESKDLVAPNVVWNIACYGDAEDGSSPVNFDNWRTGPNNYLRIFTPTAASEVGESQRHDGRWRTSAYTLSRVGGTVLAVTGTAGADHVRIEGLQILGRPGTSSFRGIWSKSIGPSGDIRISDCIIRGPTADNPIGWGIQVSATDKTAIHRIWNNVVFGIETNGPASIIIGEQSGDGLVYLYNNTLLDKISSYSPMVVAINNFVLGKFSGSYDELHSSHNAASEGTPPGNNAISLSSASRTDYFPIADDFRLDRGAAKASDLLDRGMDLSADPVLPVTDDLTGTPRPQGPAFDIGAHEAK